MDYKDIINIICALVTTSATVILAVLTSRYVRLTNAIAEESKRSRDPLVYVDIEPSNHCVKLVVGNAGMTAAHDVRVDIQDEVEWNHLKKHFLGFQPREKLKNGIPYLAPQRVLKYELGSPNWQKLQQNDGLLKVNIQFRNDENILTKKLCQINLSQYLAVSMDSFSNSSKDIVRAINGLERSTREKDHGLRSALHQFNQKKCPMCGEGISRSAKKCPKCLEFIDVPVSAQEPAEP
ncbi:MAG TPA: zinc ribbon domain-containing protein [Geobacteraceae bacterium]